MLTDPADTLKFCPKPVRSRNRTALFLVNVILDCISDNHHSKNCIESPGTLLLTTRRHCQDVNPTKQNSNTCHLQQNNSRHSCHHMFRSMASAFLGTRFTAPCAQVYNRVSVHPLIHMMCVYIKLLALDNFLLAHLFLASKSPHDYSKFVFTQAQLINHQYLTVNCSIYHLVQNNEWECFA